MPELPDVLVYVEALERRILGAALQHARILSPFVLRTFDPPLEACEGRTIEGIERLGKRIVLRFEQGLFLVIHLMIAGRLRWFKEGDKGAGKIELARLGFEHGTLALTEAGTQKRASIQVVSGRAALAAMDPGGIDVLACSSADFAAALRRENHTLKRSLTTPQLFAGIGNAYSDEILHAARLSPVRLTRAITDDEAAALHTASVSTLTHWHAELRREFGMESGIGRFPGPGEITAFRPGFSVHGRFGLPCPVCGTSVRRIVYAANECNYCSTCQTRGKVLADRSLSRLLKEDWQKEMEDR